MYFSISYMQSNRLVTSFIGDRNEILGDYAKLDAVALRIQYLISESKLSLVGENFSKFENVPYLIYWSLLDNIFFNTEETLRRIILEIGIYVLVNNSVYILLVLRYILISLDTWDSWVHLNILIWNDFFFSFLSIISIQHYHFRALDFFDLLSRSLGRNLNLIRKSFILIQI